MIRNYPNPNSTQLCDDEDAPVDQIFVMNGDNNIQYLEQLMSPVMIVESINKGIYFAKIRAKIIEIYYWNKGARFVEEKWLQNHDGR